MAFLVNNFVFIWFFFYLVLLMCLILGKKYTYFTYKLVEMVKKRGKGVEWYESYLFLGWLSQQALSIPFPWSASTTIEVYILDFPTSYSTRVAM